jgi:hypothetical protein
VGREPRELAQRLPDRDWHTRSGTIALRIPKLRRGSSELLRRHERNDEALVWAEKGIAAFGEERLDDLVEFWIHEHLRPGSADSV